MAKKKKAAKSKKAPKPEIIERSSFWGYAAAVLMIVLALFLLLGGFGTGGTLPKMLFGVAYWLVGWAAWLTPPVLVFWGVYKFVAEDHRLPLGQRLSMFGFLIVSGSFFHTTFANTGVTGEVTGGHGGTVGKLVGGGILALLDKVPATILFFLCTVFAFFFAFGIPPKIIVQLFQKRDREDDVDGLEALQSKAAENGFKLNEGVPVEHHGSKAIDAREPCRTYGGQ
jgi:hypothetical protein